MTQKEFAEFFDIPLRTIQKWEQHDSEPASYLVSLMEEKINTKDSFDVSIFKRKPQKSFRVTNKHRFLNNEKIHPIQQYSIEEILNVIKEYEEARKVIIFGSSTEERCNYDSDIDIYVELTKDINVKKFNVDKPVDFWTNFTVSDEMLREIESKGVVVYAR